MRGSLRIIACLCIPVFILAWALALFVSLYSLPGLVALHKGPGAGVLDAHLHKLYETYNGDIQKDSLIIDDKPDNYFWFIHVSDIHISRFRDFDRGSDFIKFCSQVVPTISPSHVVVTGDLTDAKDAYLMDSMQHLEEWKEYSRILKDTRVLEKTKWVDIRGNHDAFDVLDAKHSGNLFATYSQSKNTSYSFTHETSFGKYRFIAVDACPNPGPRRPFNFFGILDNQDLNELETRLAKPEDYNHTIVFGHYPLSTVYVDQSSKGITLRGLSRKFSMYLCGHLHTLLDIAPNLHMRHSNELAELEIGDWKDNRRYRVIAFDHDLFSYTDTKLDEWPVVIITNPKDAGFLLPTHEPLHRLPLSTHIRVLAFSIAEVMTVEISLDNGPFESATPKGGSLWVLPWKPQTLGSGLHQITVKVVDAKGNTKFKKNNFSVDGTLDQINWIARFILLTDFTLALRIAFYCLEGFILIFLFILPKFLVQHYKSTNKYDFFILSITHSIKKSIDQAITSSAIVNAKSSTSSLPWLFFLKIHLSVPLLLKIFLLRFVILCQVSWIYWPLLIHVLWILVFPWFIGELVHGHIGMFFSFGMILNGKFIREHGTYLFSFQHLLLVVLPTITYLASRVPLEPLMKHISLHRYDRSQHEHDSDSDSTENENDSISESSSSSASPIHRPSSPVDFGTHSRAHSHSHSHPHSHTHSHSHSHSTTSSSDTTATAATAARAAKEEQILDELLMSPTTYNERHENGITLWVSRLIYGLLAFYHFNSVKFILDCYGFTAFALSPGKTWFFILSVLLVVYVDKLISYSSLIWRPRLGYKLVPKHNET